MLQYLPPWLPGMGFLKVAEEGYKVSMDMYKKPYEMFKKNFVGYALLVVIEPKLI